MNKFYLILGGTSVASLAAGAAGGYFYAKKRFDEQLDLGIAVEVDKTRRHYAVLLMEAKNAKPSLAEVTESYEDDEEEADRAEEPLDEADLAAIEKGRKNLAEASKALTDYQGASTKKAGEGDVVLTNIFETSPKPRKRLPPRDEETGKFLSSSVKVKVAAEQTPYIIDAETFLLNDPGHDQEILLYFAKDETLIQVYDSEPVENNRVGEVNLTLFPDVPDGEPSIICVRNEGLQIDYEIKRTYESLTTFMGLGEDDADLEEDDNAYSGLDEG